LWYLGADSVGGEGEAVDRCAFEDEADQVHGGPARAREEVLAWIIRLSSFFFCCGSEKEHYRLLSLAMRKLERRFSIAECTYGISRDKENTIRSRINSMGIAHSYTLETSLYGWRNQQGEVRHFN
jgi:hypothetical protein